MAEKVSRSDVCQQITDKILAHLEAGVRPWSQPWKNGQGPAGGSALPLRHCGTPYRGINTIMLWASAASAGHHNRYWLTFKQALEYGAAVRKGEKGTQVVYAGAITKETKNEDTGETAEERIPFLKAYYVFNAEQIDGLPDRYTRPPAPLSEPERDAAADAFFAATGATVQHGGDRAFYLPGHDRIQMPVPAAFRDMPAYYHVLAHEFTHWTGVKTRLDRNMTGRFGNPEYAFEELIAELGSAFVSAHLGLGTEEHMRDDHAPYLASWIRHLKDDKRAIVKAASLATAALDYLVAFSQPAEVPVEGEVMAEAA